MTGSRLPSGGVIDRARAVPFTWDGRRMEGRVGDTLASALMANGERVVARGFKYHRPRGVMAAGPEEGGALVTVGEGARRTPNQKAPEVELIPGLAASGQNAWPSVRFDLGRVNDLLGRFFAAGFYYKTFFGVGRGTWAWMQFEKVIRRAAGMGRASEAADPDAHEIVHDFCDLLVVGAGVAGLAAAEQAAADGLDVIVAERDFVLGAALAGTAEPVEGAAPADWVAARRAALSGARVLSRTTGIGLYDGNVVGLYERVAEHGSHPSIPLGRLRIVRPGAVILATGAIERPIAFGDNDRPGVMLASAAASYVERFGVAPGESAAIATTNDTGYRAATVLARAGIRTTLLDAREAGAEEVRGPAEAAGVEVLAGHVPVAVKGANGVRGLEIGRLEGGEIHPRGPIYRDVVGLSGGWSPAIHLVCHRGVRPVWDEDLLCFRSGEPPQGVALTGAAAGVFGMEDALAHARATAEQVARRLLGRNGAATNRPAPAPGGLGPIAPLWEVRVPGRKMKSFADPQHDVTTDDVRLAAQEGYVSVEHMKRYTTLGMATDQGKTGGVLGLAVLADALGQTIPETGITTFRPPYTPTPIAAFAGRDRGAHWRPTRRTPMHGAQEVEGCVFTDAGLWKRCWYAPRPGETLAEAYLREARTVREAVGMVDVTSLGKIAVQGPDAAELLNRVYVNGFAKLPVMRCRYGVMLRDDGIVFDDGVTWRLGEHEFLMTATTAMAGPVLAWLETLLATRWPDLRVHVASTTDQWAGIAVAGPRARAALAPMVAGAMDDGALPFMGIIRAPVRVEGGTVPALIARISFSGEMAYEVYVPSDFGPALWHAVQARVEAEGGAIYGVEALGALRIEKGHVTHAELDGRVTLEDAGLGRMASTKKPFIGQALRKRPDLAREDRPRLAQFEPVREIDRFSIGAIVCEPDHVEGHGIGWITGVTVAPAFEDRWVGIGFVSGGWEAWEGREVVIADPVRGRECRATVHDPHRLDPTGERMKGTANG